MKATQTPGPWGVNDLAANGAAHFIAPDGRKLPVGYIVQAGSEPLAACVKSLSDALAMAAAPVMLSALQKCLASAISRRDAAKVYTDKSGNPSKADVQADIDEIRAAIALATGAPTGEAAGAGPTGEAAPVRDFAGHAGAIEAAQGYVSDPETWNPPSPTQVAHLLALSGISHGPIAVPTSETVGGEG